MRSNVIHGDQVEITIYSFYGFSTVHLSKVYDTIEHGMASHHYNSHQSLKWSSSHTLLLPGRAFVSSWKWIFEAILNYRDSLRQADHFSFKTSNHSHANWTLLYSLKYKLRFRNWFIAGAECSSHAPDQSFTQFVFSPTEIKVNMATVELEAIEHDYIPDQNYQFA